MTLIPSDPITISRADYAGLQEELNALRVKVSDYRKLLKLQKQRTLAAHRLYQQAHGWSELEFPDLGELVAWLVAERTRLLADYRLLEELAPPDLPRPRFVKLCFDAWEQSDALRESLRLAIAWGELTDEQLDELQRTAGISLAEIAGLGGPETREARSA